VRQHNPLTTRIEEEREEKEREKRDRESAGKYQA
jgi:hypothetical protein